MYERKISTKYMNERKPTRKEEEQMIQIEREKVNEKKQMKNMQTKKNYKEQ